jgi:phosphate transport system protein
MRNAYRISLETTRLDVVRLGALSIDAVHIANSALERSDASLAGRVVAGDDEIDTLRRRVEASCIELIWKQQPVAGELRQIAGMLQIVTDLERIGDYAVDIAKNSLKLIDVPLRPARVEIGRISAVAEAMLDETLRAYREEDIQIAEAVIERDDELDALYKEAIEALQEEMAGDSGLVRAGTQILFVLATLERVGDRAQNIAWHTKEMLGVA